VNDRLRRHGGLTEQARHYLERGRFSESDRSLLDEIEERLRDLWNLGRNLVLAWTPVGRTIHTLFMPNYIIAGIGKETRGKDATANRDDDHTFVQRIFSESKCVTEERLSEISRRLSFEPSVIELSFEPGMELPLDVIDKMIDRYGLTYVEDRAVALFDIVGFSLHSPLEQVAQLNSLAYSMNSAHSKMLTKQMGINFTRTTTGDGFYVWNRDRSIQANVNLYHFMHLVLADNAIARRKSSGNVTPLLRASFHVGGHYEFYQAEGLNPTTYSYIVGDVTIELARLIERALAGQIVLGDFQVPVPDAATGEMVRIDAVEFIERTQETLSSLEGLSLSGEAIDAIKCYLTGAQNIDGDFTIKKYRVTDKHGLSRHAYNAKVNIYRENSEPIYLGIQDSELGAFAPAVEDDEPVFDLEDA